MLDPEERYRLSRFRFEPDARSFVIAHALARKALSAYADVSADAWQFRVSAHGRPELAGPPIPAPRFNLSHTRELVACVVTDSVDAGIDVEAETVADDPLELAVKIFSPEEIQALGSAPLESRRARFLSIWTLKEAYSKARGLGSSTGLARPSSVELSKPAWSARSRSTPDA